MKKLICLLVMLLLFSGRANSQNPNPTTEIISEPVEAMIQINNRYIGNTPLEIDQSTIKKFGNFRLEADISGVVDIVMDSIVIKATPVGYGYVQKIVIPAQRITNITQRIEIPGTIFFNMQLTPPPKKYEYDVEIQ